MHREWPEVSERPVRDVRAYWAVPVLGVVREVTICVLVIMNFVIVVVVNIRKQVLAVLPYQLASSHHISSFPSLY